MARHEVVTWDPPPPEEGLDPYRVLQVHPDAQAEVIEAAFAVLREIACADDTAGGRDLVRLTWAHRVLLQR